MVVFAKTFFVFTIIPIFCSKLYCALHIRKSWNLLQWFTSFLETAKMANSSGFIFDQITLVRKYSNFSASLKLTLEMKAWSRPALSIQQKTELCRVVLTYDTYFKQIQFENYFGHAHISHGPLWYVGHVELFQYKTVFIIIFNFLSLHNQKYKNGTIFKMSSLSSYVGRQVWFT
jgi:hypothetical protein